MKALRGVEAAGNGAGVEEEEEEEEVEVVVASCEPLESFSSLPCVSAPV